MRSLFRKKQAPPAAPEPKTGDPLAQQIAEQLAQGMAFDRAYFRLWEQHGFHITPNHFYQPVPDVSQLKESLWSKPSALAGIDMNDAGQIMLLEQVCALYQSEYNQFPTKPSGRAHDYYFDQPMFRSVDAEILYCIIRHYKPARIVEIGSGFSTLVAAAACRKNQAEGTPTELTSIEPYPNDVLRAGVPGLAKLMTNKLEDIDLSFFTSLGENDILFIDSSHVLRIGNDVYHEYLHILPRIAPGVFVHVHDIFLPFEYPRQWVMDEYRFWSEQYLLQAFLMFNSAFQVIWGGSYMHHTHSDKLRSAFRSYDPATVWPGSFWMRRMPNTT